MLTDLHAQTEEQKNLVHKQIFDLANQVNGRIGTDYSVSFKYDLDSDMTWIRVSRFDIDQGGFVDEIDTNFTMDQRRVVNHVIGRLSDLVEMKGKEQ